jgi:hypothetical protein
MSTFTYFGEEFSYAPEFPRFAYAEFCEALADGEEASSEQSTGAALRLAIQSVAEGDRKRFRQVSRKHNAKVDDWLVVFRDWTADEAERPTGQPSDSADGQPDIAANSEQQHVASVTSLPERPDLALARTRSAV